MELTWLDPERPEFPPVDRALADPNGLLAAGGALTPSWLVKAYQSGIFPWYEAGQPILWWTPDPRLVLFPDELHVSRSLRRLIARQRYRASLDEDFAGVIAACAAPRVYATGTWITAELSRAYQRLHELGIAHSVEIWDDTQLVGGLYGVALGRVFFGESMFSRQANTSKLALAFLVEQLRKWGYQLVDCQVATPHLASLGAREIPRRDFMGLLDQLVNGAVGPASWPGRSERTTGELRGL